MRDLNIDEDFDVPTNIEREEVIDEILRFSDIDFSDMNVDELKDKIGKIVDEHIENHTHTNGKVYVDDWDVFDNDLRHKIRNIVDNNTL